MIIKTLSKIDINNKPVVILPLKEWQKIEGALEEFETLTSITYKRKITKARKEKTNYSSKKAKEILKI